MTHCQGVLAFLFQEISYAPDFLTSNQKLGIQVKDIFYTPGGPHDAAIIIEAEGPEPINKFMSSVQSLGNVKMKFIRAFSIEEMRKMV